MCPRDGGPAHCRLIIRNIGGCDLVIKRGYAFLASEPDARELTIVDSQVTMLMDRALMVGFGHHGNQFVAPAGLMLLAGFPRSKFWVEVPPAHC